MPLIQSSAHTSSYLSADLKTRLHTARTHILEHWQLDTTWLDAFKQHLEKTDVVSVDVFDTALTRSVETPVDVFALMEECLITHYGAEYEGFAVKREAAERAARLTAWQNFQYQEITHQSIYAELERLLPNTSCKPESLAALEIDIEHHVCLQTPDIHHALMLAHQAGKAIVFVSDMYLSGATIRQLLINAHYTAPLDLLVSSETLHTKADGSQWQVVKDKYGPNARILHIGDNSHSDVASPNKHGITAYPYFKARSVARNGGPLCPAIIPFSIASRVAHLTQASSVTKHTAMAQLGTTWGALVVGSYANWLAERATTIKAEHIFFCARDGELPYAAWKTMGLGDKTHIPSSYLYISRKALNFGAAALTCRSDYLSPEALEILTQIYKPNTIHTLLSRIGFEDSSPIMAQAAKQFSSLQTTVFWNDQPGLEKFKTFLQDHAAHVYARLCLERDNAIAYLCQQGLHNGPVALVDVGWHGTMQTSITQLLRHAGHTPKIYGFYCGLWNRTQRNRPTAGWMDGAFGNDFIPDAAQYALRNAVPILENLFAASHGTTLGYQNQHGKMAPVLASSDIETAQHNHIIKPFQQATLTALGHLTTSGQHLTLSAADLTLTHAFAALSRLALCPTPSERREIGALQHCSDISHAHYVPLVHTSSPQNIPDYASELNKSEWPIATALTFWEQCSENQKGTLSHTLWHHFCHYDARTQAQFQ